MVLSACACVRRRRAASGGHPEERENGEDRGDGRRAHEAAAERCGCAISGGEDSRRCRHGGEHGNAEGGTDLVAGHQEARGHSRVLGGDPGHRGGGDGDEDGTRAEADDDQSGQQVEPRRTPCSTPETGTRPRRRDDETDEREDRAGRGVSA